MIPLVRSNSVEDINTSLIATRREIENGGSGSGSSMSNGNMNVNVNVIYDIIDEVKAGSGLPVTSNAVADVCARFPDYARGNLYTSASTSYTCTEDCYVVYTYFTNDSTARVLRIDGVQVATGAWLDRTVITFSGYVKKGSVLTNTVGDSIGTSYLKVFGLI